ncbi:hypothetical protein CYPRO_2027 [Cyclonatronum proteinivorum]|uniref:Uncharacterized protein n=1 Tax=Cyclonatronum proteinivorum TaxID=1457365 RepID=A0A345ULC5_9BACT|nr:hypothetical protein CYPRO_2027 [Cyclonatronum proteinivorum]
MQRIPGNPNDQNSLHSDPKSVLVIRSDKHTAVIKCMLSKISSRHPSFTNKTEGPIKAAVSDAFGGQPPYLTVLSSFQWRFTST